MKRLLALSAVAALLWGATDEPIAPLGTYSAAERRYWAFQPRVNVQPPAFSDAAAKAWVRTPIDAFANDRSPMAWEKVIERLLASPQYGEQWGRHWLDVVRFAESDGYEYDMHRPDGYRYRDYVVRSFNEDKPYDQFVKEQIAGDEMDPANESYRVASGFNRLGPLRDRKSVV